MKKRILCLLCCIAMLAVLPTLVYAHEVPDYNRTGSVSVTMSYKGKPVSGGTLTIYRVADVSEDDGNYFFTLVDALDGHGISLENLSDADLAGYILKALKEEEIKGTSQKIDKNGEAVFEELPIGLYLVAQTKAASGYNAAAPFLVGVPNRENDSYVYEVDASPKVELETAPTKPTEPGTQVTVPEKLPQTGQNQWPVPVMLVVGCLFVVTGFWLCASGKEKKNEA